MIEDLRFARADIPRELEIQVLAFMRIVWGDGFPGDERFRTRLWEDERAVHFVRADGDLLVSHAQIVVPEVTHDGHALRIAGVGGVMTYPQFPRRGPRDRGHAARHRSHPRRPAFDMGMLFCAPETVAFYGGSAGRCCRPRRVHVGAAEEPEDDFVMTVGDTTALPAVLRLDWSW